MKCGKRSFCAAVVLAGVMTFSGITYAAGGFHEPEPLGDQAVNFAGGSYAEHRLEKIAEENGEKPESESETAAETQSETKPQTETQPQTTATEQQTQPPINVIQTDTNTPLINPQPQTEVPAPHRYELVQADVTWDQARQVAAAKGGYLVHIDSLDEYNTILSQIQSEQKENVVFMIGGRRDPNERAYYWVDQNGTADKSVRIDDSSYWVNTNNDWLVVDSVKEPTYTGKSSDNNGYIPEVVLDIFQYKNSSSSQNMKWLWNDVPEDITSYYPGRVGYIIEYDS